MSSAAHVQLTTAASPEVASAAVLRVLAENKHRVVEQSPGGLQLTFLTKKTMFTWELAAQAAITPNGTGSTINIGLDTAAGRPAALLDGKKNEKAANKLAEQITAALA